ncbi:MAG: GNAT family N-acetyltransferase [Actinomycetota bacterium]
MGWVRERGTLWTLDLSAPVAVREPAVAAAWEECGAAGELAVTMGAGAAGVERRLRRGCRAFAARVDGRIACYGWVSAGSECIGELEREIRLPPGEAYVWDCFTVPAHRRLGLYASLLPHIARALQAEGTARLWIGTARANRPSIRGFEAAGFVPVLEVLSARAGSVSCLAFRPAAEAPAGLAPAALQALVRRDEAPVGPVLVGHPRPAELPLCSGAD